MIRQTYQIAGIQNYAEMGFAECHGTGTLVGDPIETTAIGNIFGDSKQSEGIVFIGSVKPNLGHGEGASGLTSLLKAVLALEKRTREGEVFDLIQVAATVAGHEAQTDSFVTGLRAGTPLSSPGNRLVRRRDPRISIYHNSGVNAEGSLEGTSNDGLKSFLSSARENPSLLATPEAAELLATEIGRKVMLLLMKPADEEVNTGLGLTALGMDSLVGIEMWQWLKATLGLDMSVVQLTSMGTLGNLGKVAAEGLAKQYAARG